MWRTDLSVSNKQYILVSLCYLLLILTMIIMFAHTWFADFTFIGVIILVIEWWRTCCYIGSVRGELALFYDINELYWSKQRFSIVKKPLFLHYAVVIHLVSKRNHKKRVLFLMNDSFSRQDWRSLNHFLRQFVAN